MGDKFDKELLIICAPNIGVLENWNPIFEQLKLLDKNIKIICLFVKPSFPLLVDPESDLIKATSVYLDSVIYPTYSGKWQEYNSLIGVNKVIPNNRYNDTLLKLIHSKARKKISKIPLVKKLLDKFIGYFSKWMYANKNSYLDLNQRLENVNTVFCDITDLCTKTTRPYREILINIPSFNLFSIHHAINIHTADRNLWSPYFEWNNFVINNERDNSYKLNKVLPNCKNVKQYIFTHYDENLYRELYGLSERQISKVSLPRHNKKWMGKMADIHENNREHLDSKKNVVLFSRPPSTYLPEDRKERSLRDIKSIVIDKLGLKLIIKCHPKENNIEIYEKVFGAKRYGVDWDFSNTHPFALGINSEFCITFYSSVSIDMILLNTPTIEYLNLTNIKEFDNSRSLRDANTYPVFDYRYYKLVLGANNKSELENCAIEIIKNKKNISKKNMESYTQIFGESHNSSLEIAKEILDIGQC